MVGLKPMPPSTRIGMMAHMLDIICPGGCLNQQPRLSESLRRALQVRVDALEEEQAADVREFDLLYLRSDKLLLLIVERQQCLRQFREILLARWLV
jgi:hypothetical protein